MRRGIYILLVTFLGVGSSCFAQNYSEYTDRGWDLLFFADTGQTDSLLYVLQNSEIDVDFETNEGVTALMLASQAGYDDIVEILIKHGADVNKKSEYYGITPLISAVRNNFLRTAEILIRNGADINDNDNFGRMAVHYAAMYGYAATTDMLIYYFADINDSDVFGNSPLLYAISNKHNEVSDILVANGADLYIKNKLGNSLLHIASHNGNMHFIQNYYHYFTDRKEVLNNDSISAVEMAVLYGRSEVLEFLIDNSFKLRDTINEIYTPLTLAKAGRDRKTKKIIKEMGYGDIHYPYFNRVGGGMGILFNSTDYFWDFNIALTEDRYGFVFATGFLTRGKEKQIFVPKNKWDFYQYYEKRYGVYFKLQKHFGLISTSNNYFGIYAQVRPVFFWGNYIGVKDNIPADIINAPGIGLSANFGRLFRMNFSYEYLDMNIYTVKPHFFSVGFKILPSVRSKKTNEKYKYIINY